MKENLSKFQGILFRRNKQVTDFKVSVDGYDIGASISMTSLGICIDDTLTFDSHISDLCLKASRQISALRGLTVYCIIPAEMRSTVVLYLHTLIIAHLCGFSQAGLV